MNETPKTGRGWRILRRILIGLAVLATLVAALVTEENWRGKRALENYRRELETKGEKLDWQAFVPPPVPNDQNFFAAPIVAAALNSERNQYTDTLEKGDTNGVSRMGFIFLEKRGTNVVNPMDFNIYRGDSKNWPRTGGNWQKGTLIDLKEWQRYLRTFSESPEGKTNGFPVASQPQTPAADILLALSVFDPAIEELRQASQRPYARIPLNYGKNFNAAGELLPWLANMKRCAQFLQLRTLAELENGQSDKALEDIKLQLRVNDSIREQPFLISHLVRMAIMAITIPPIYEGLGQHRWSDAQLKELEQVLAKQDFLADFQFAMRGERAFAIASFENQRRTREVIVPLENGGSMTLKLTWMPSAYFYQNELAFARLHKQLIETLVDLTNRIVAPAALRRSEAAVQSQLKHYSPYKVQALMLFPAIANSVTKFTTIQAQIDLAGVACALERYRIAHGEYPESLDALAPQFIEILPHDIINGQPLHYRRTNDGRFVLYSVGLNETDDGGAVVLLKSGVVDREKGDWVWQYPAK